MGATARGDPSQGPGEQTQATASPNVNSEDEGSTWSQGPLAFNCPKLEAQFGDFQRRKFLAKAVWFVYFIIVANICTPIAKLLVLGTMPLKGGLWSLGFIASSAAYAKLLSNPPAWYSKWHTVLAIAFRIQSGFITVLLRGIYPEVLGQDPLTPLTYFRDFYHGGMCQFNLTAQSIGFPLLYWPHLAIQMFMTIFSMSYDGWLCTMKLAGPNMDATVPWLASHVIRPFTFITKGVLGQVPVLWEHEEGAINSCLGATTFMQCCAGLVMYCVHVWREISNRREFLKKHSNTPVRLRTAFANWPLGRPVGLCRCIVAFVIPLLCYCLLWQGVLAVIAWQQTGTMRLGPVADFIIRLPHGFA